VRRSTDLATTKLKRVLHPGVEDVDSSPLDLEASYQSYIKRLHKDNETRDLGGILLGLLGLVSRFHVSSCSFLTTMSFRTAEQATTKVMYERYGLDLDD